MPPKKPPNHYTLEYPDVTTSSDHNSLRVPERGCSIFILPNYEYVCPGCGYITTNMQTLETHIKGKKDRTCCVDYACKFGSYIKLDVKKNEAVNRQFPNITWVNGLMGLTIPDEDLATANEQQKEWLINNNFPTSCKQAGQFTKLTLPDLTYFLGLKQRTPDDYERMRKCWHIGACQQFDAFESNQMERDVKDEKVISEQNAPPAEQVNMMQPQVNDKVGAAKTVTECTGIIDDTTKFVSTSSDAATLKRSAENDSVGGAKKKGRKKKKKEGRSKPPPLDEQVAKKKLKPPPPGNELRPTRKGNRSSSK